MAQKERPRQRSVDVVDLVNLRFCNKHRNSSSFRHYLFLTVILIAVNEGYMQTKTVEAVER